MDIIPIKYDPKFVEEKIYHYWMKGGYFFSFPEEKKKSYTILMPPPNITGILHIGHLLNNTIQDVLIRYARMKGYNACWIPGTDHASIATEAKIVHQLKQRGISKTLIGRNKFLSYVYEWSDKHQNIIFQQLKKLGCSCDWNRIQFTMDEKLSKSVKKIFIDLYKMGYIYRGYRIVNWDTVAKTTISDEEVFYEEKKDKLFYIKYPIVGEKYSITIATTRPETVFGDSAICFHPNDFRFFHFKNKEAVIPIVNRIIPIIQDSYVDPSFGSGCLKITPAHNEDDKILSEKYNLKIINIFNDDATLNDKGLHYQGMDRFKVRKKVIKELSSLGYIEKVENIQHKIGFSERTKSVVEKKMSLQWFLKTKKMSFYAINAVKNGEINFYPNTFKKVYYQWMNKIRDWNISRQLWWGHRLPVYYYGNHINDFVVASNIEEALEQAKNKSKNENLTLDKIRQDSDVLDTWFSSWILPISVFDGFYKPNSKEISYYYPTENLVTGSDILFFWVARMIMAGYFFRKNKPFKNVYFTGILRDDENKKISKSLENSQNFVELIDKYGADSVRMGIMMFSSAGKDFHFDEKICLQGRNFLNKIWNAFRLIKSWKIEEKKAIPEASGKAILWFENRFYSVLETFENNIRKYKLDESLMIIYKLVWNDFCSIFLEIVKPPHGKKEISENVYLKTIKWFENLLKLLHPYIPFISEKIWTLLRKRKNGEALIISSWPKQKSYDKNILISFERVIQIISKIRFIRNKIHIPYKESLIFFSMKEEEKEFYPVILKLENISKIHFLSKEPKEKKQLFYFFLGTDRYFLFLDQKISSVEINISNIEKKIKYLHNLLSFIRKNLRNDQYLKSVPKSILLKEKKKENDTLKKISYFEDILLNKKKFIN
ncbi:valine--tRNA ligase [Blattabacterium cuenoti]|uniref:valine--tRNA ligase n=1 Tax=Blattabacterium cuenoti TaxID=1653831 RepID=UPI00163C0EFB|nr:valine--tRNA ligase [Blattabacterium cuenoti]